MIYTISNHPRFNTISRKAELDKLSFDETKKTIATFFKIHHFIGVEAIPELNKVVSFLADNNLKYTIIEGKLSIYNKETMPDVKDQEIVGDFDIFYNQIMSGTPFIDVLQQAVIMIDSPEHPGNINKKMNYKKS